jgi:hypothetical protein
MHLIDISDGGLICTDSYGEVAYDQPCVAYFDGQQLLFGDEALANVKSYPQACDSQYMTRLSDEALASPLGEALNNADLIFHHLKKVATTASVEDCVFLIPAFFSDEQLQLLLGIALAASLTPRGFINSGLARQTFSNKHNFYLLDIGLRQGQLSDVQLNNSMLSNTSIGNYDSLGLISIVDTWLQEIAKVFLDSIRFDPLHSAMTEQLIFNEILTWIDQGEFPKDAKVSLIVDGYSRGAEIDINQLINQLSQQLDKLGLTKTNHLVLTPRAAKIPMLVSLLEKLVASVYVSNNRLYFEQALRLVEGFEPEQVDRLNSYPLRNSIGIGTLPDTPSNNSINTEPTPSGVKRAPATHLLGDNAATAITDRTFETFLDEDGLLRPNAQVLIDGQPAIQAKLKHGDQVSFAASSWLAIHVE